MPKFELFAALLLAQPAAASLRGPVALGELSRRLTQADGAPAPAPMLVVVDLPTVVPLADECKKALEEVSNDTSRKEAMEECDKQGQFVEAAVEDLKASNYDQAEKKLSERYVKCAKLTSKCAENAAKITSMDIRMMGAGVSTACEAEFNATEKRFDLDCENGHYLTKVGQALKDQDLKGAVTAMEADLLECSKLGAARHRDAEDSGICQECAKQLGPVMLYNLIIAAANRKVANGDVAVTEAKPTETADQAYQVTAQLLMKSGAAMSAEVMARHSMQAVLHKAAKVLPAAQLQRLSSLLETAFEHTRQMATPAGGLEGEEALRHVMPSEQALAEINALLEVANERSRALQ